MNYEKEINEILDSLLVNVQLQERLRDVLVLAYQKGRNSILKELEHEQQKFLDGFAHQKDCELCHLPDRPLNNERE
jgi:hypothetical protein